MKGLSNLGIFVLWLFLGGGLYLHLFEGWSFPSNDGLFYILIGVGVILYFMNSSISKVESNLLEKISNLSSSEVVQKISIENEKVKDGPFEVFHDSYGSVKLEGNYLNGKKSGVWEYFSPEGILLISGNYKNGVKDGIWKDYWCSKKPTLHFQVTYENGKIIDGPFESFYENGQLLMTGNYYKGRKHGIWKSYDENGEIYHQGTFRNGILVEYVYTYENNDENHLKVRVEIINPRHWLVLYFYPPRGLKKPVVKSSFEIYDKKTLGVCSNYDEWGGLIKDEWVD